MTSHVGISTDQTRAIRVRHRLLAVVAAVAAPLVVWVVASLSGASLEVISPVAGTMRIDALLVIVTALALALAAWGMLALLERFTRSARRIWTIVAVAVLVLSLPPLAFLDATVGTKVALAVMHIATGLTLILMLRRGARVE
ncbi:MAG: DUF6069 family protein [Actinomycetota bacterium]|nr:DUF6069 family protein [Actinomycetota bacterium]